MAKINTKAKSGPIDNFQKFNINDEGNFAAVINGINYEIIYRDDISEMYDLFANGEKIASDTNMRKLMSFDKYANGGGVGEENEVVAFFNNIDYSKLPPAFGEYIRKEVLTDDDLQFLSPREPIFLEMKSKIEEYSNKAQAPTSESEEKKKVIKEIADLEGLKDLVDGEELNKINKELDDLNGLLPLL